MLENEWRGLYSCCNSYANVNRNRNRNRLTCNEINCIPCNVQSVESIEIYWRFCEKNAGENISNEHPCHRGALWQKERKKGNKTIYSLNVINSLHTAFDRLNSVAHMEKSDHIRVFGWYTQCGSDHIQFIANASAF